MDVVLLDDENIEVVEVMPEDHNVEIVEVLLDDDNFEIVEVMNVEDQVPVDNNIYMLQKFFDLITFMMIL